MKKEKEISVKEIKERKSEEQVDSEKSVENKNIKHKLMKVLLWIGLAYSLGVISLLNRGIMGQLGELLNSSSLVGNIMTAELIPAVELAFAPIRYIVASLPFALYIIAVVYVVHKMLSKFKYISSKELNIYTSLLILSFFL